jgi:hypothetical protein
MRALYNDETYRKDKEKDNKYQSFTYVRISEVWNEDAVEEGEGNDGSGEAEKSLLL